jgi:group I intron endonuclease
MKYTVYLRTNLVNGKRYVGQTNNFKNRERTWKCLTSRYANFYLTEERNKYGLENFKTEILAEVETREDAWELEQKFILELNTKYPNGYNKSNGGETNTGYKHSNEQKEKWSKMRKGIHFFPENEWKKGDEPWIKGKHHTAESNEKNRLAHLGKISKKRKPVVQLTKDGVLIKEYSHCESAAKEMGFKCDESIRKACKENWRTSGGFKWMYKEDYEKMLGESNS